MLSRFCPAGFGVLFCSVVLAADKHLKRLGCVVSVARCLTFGVFECDIAHRRSVRALMSAVQDQVLSDAPSLWFSTYAVFASAGYTRCSGRISVYSLQKLAVPQDLYSPLSVSFEPSC